MASEAAAPNKVAAKRAVENNAAEEAVDHLRALLRIDTTNPPGQETAAAEYMADLFRVDGIEPVLLEKAKGRANCVARVPGSGEQPPLLLAAHLDVVEAEPSRWKHAPFVGEMSDGYLWGRGAIDMKNMAIMSAMALKLIKRSGARLKRDLIFAGVADEEMGCEMGSQFLVEEHPDLVRAEYALGEVGGFTLHMAGRRFYPIQVAEKGVCWMRWRTQGQPGHGSLPRDDSALVKLAAAVEKIGTQKLPQHTTEVLSDFVHQVAAALPLVQRVLFERLLDPYLAPLVLRIMPDRSIARSFAALLSNTAAPTVFRAGNKTNVIGPEASCEVDGRILPGQTEASFLAEIRALVGEEIEIEVIRSTPPTSTSAATPLFELLCEKVIEHDPGSLPVPYLAPGFTDAKSWSRLGTKCYGFSPVKIDQASGLRFADLFHGDNERIPIEGFKWGLEVLYDVVHEFCVG